MSKYFLSNYKEDAPSYNLLKASLLQKLIRRGMVHEANYVAQLYLNENQSKGLKRRLQIIAAEDIGIGWPESVLYIEQNQDNLIQVTSALAQANKNRESDRFLLAVAYNFDHYKNHYDKNVRIECKSLNHLFNFSKQWFENKNAKTLSSLKIELAKMEKYDFNKEAIHQLTENYISLTKQKVHGARCQLALAVLLYIRQIPVTGFQPIDDIAQKPFDEIFDFAIDMHTPIGKDLKRDFNHWVENCVQVKPELFYDSLYDEKGIEKYPLVSESNKFNK